MPGYEMIGNEELAEIQDVFSNGGVLFRHGFDALRNNCFKVGQFERDFANHMGSNFALAVTSGTAAIRVALAALGIGEEDEVIAPCFTFVATVEAIIESGAKPICAEIDSTLNLDPKDLQNKITSRTKAVIVVHMLGSPARLREISDICRDRGIYLIEDTAWGCGGNLLGKKLGTWGDVGTFSFDFAKTMTTGEGGMILFQNELIWKKAMAWHDHGHENNPSVPRWEDTRTSSGFNYRMMELQGAVGLAQLRKLPHIISAQQFNHANIWNAISDLVGISCREAPEGSYGTADALVFLLEDSVIAKRCRESLVSVGLTTKILPEALTWHFAGAWTHMPELVSAHGGSLQGKFLVSKSILSRAVSIPVGVNMAKDVPSLARSAIIKALSQ